jgi:hypothetical protein
MRIKITMRFDTDSEDVEPEYRHGGVGEVRKFFSDSLPPGVILEIEEDAPVLPTTGESKPCEHCQGGEEVLNYMIVERKWNFCPYCGREF